MARYPAVFRSLIAVLLLVSPGAAASEENSTAAREISIRECVETALRNNIDIAVSRAEKEIGELGIPIEEAAFLPRFTGELGANRAIVPTGSVLDNSLSVDQRIYTFDLGVTDLLRTGTALTLAFENQRQETDSAVSLLSPEYRTALTLKAAQPLLKNFGRKVTEAPLEIARAGAAEKTEKWKTKVMDIVVAARREELLRAEAAAQGAADDLKNVLGVRSGAEWEETLLPVPITGEIPAPGPEETFEEALRNRPEFSAQAARRAQAEIQEAVARNRTLPSLDLSLSAGLTGLSGTPNPNPLFPSSSGEFAGSYGESLDQTFSGRYYNWFVGLSTEIPWRFDREKAEWARARAAAEQQRLAGEALSSRIRMEVRKGWRDLTSARARIEAARASVASAAKKLDAEDKKLEFGRSTVFQVLQYQQDLSEARLVEVRARTDAYVAQTRLWRAVGTILDQEGIQVR